MNAIQALNQFIKDVLKNLTLLMDFDRQFGAQCVDLVRFWLGFLGLPQISTRPSSGAKDLWTNAPVSQKISDVSKAQPGDIFVSAATATNEWGHTGIVTSKPYIRKSDGALVVDTIEANWEGTAAKPPARWDKRVSSFIGLIRPPQFSTPEPETPKQGNFATWRVKKMDGARRVSIAYVRSKPENTASVAGSRFLIPGDVFKGDATPVIGQDPYKDGRNTWVKSQFGNFVWAANLERA